MLEHDGLVWWVHAAATWALVGLIWVVQVVVYPGFARVGGGAFVDYHADYTRRVTYVVAPLMGVELLGALYVVARPPAFLAPIEAWAGLALVVTCWVSTAAVQVPLHARLGEGRDEARIRRLVRGNWVRTLAWTARGLGLLVVALRG